MPIHLALSSHEQAFAIVAAIVVVGFCIRYWQYVAALGIALLILAGLFAFAITLDLKLAHQVIGVLDNVRRNF